MQLTEQEFRVFVMGFMASREGFNGECPYEHLAPESVFEQDDRPSLYESIEQVFDDEGLVHELRKIVEKTP